MAQTQVHIFFGSQTGTAECFAQELAEEAATHDINAQAIDLAAFTPEAMMACKIVIMVVATYGDGAPTENARTFHAWAETAKNDGCMKGARFAVMGLGDMNYTYFNNMGKMTDTNLARLGATRIYHRGAGDDSQDVAAGFKTWKDAGLWNALKKAIADVNNEGGFGSGIDKEENTAAVFSVTPDVNLFFAHEEADGAAKEICEEVTKVLGKKGCTVTLTQSLSERKAVEAVKKLNKHGLAVVIADVGPEGMCAAGRKLVRNMNLEIDPNSFKEKEIRLAMVTVATSKCNNSAGALKMQLIQATEPMEKAFLRAGAEKSKASQYIDAGVQDVPPAVEELCSAIAEAAKPITLGSPAPAAAPGGYPAGGAQVQAPAAHQGADKFGASVLKLAASITSLPPEVPGEPTDVLARFYFEAEKAKVAKTKELRQAPNQAEGLSTVEVEIEATGSLKEYALGGTLTLLPQNDPEIISAMLPILGLQQADLAKFLTFVPDEGTGNKVKRPFPTPCTLGEALARYCDLGRAPTKKMLQTLQPKLEEQTARERVAAVLADPEAMKLLGAAPLCCKMHEFWNLLGVSKIDLCDFLLFCPRQKPREFTIASSPKAQPDSITLCVSLTSHELPDLVPLAQRLHAAANSPDTNAPVMSSRGRFFGMASRWVTCQLKSGDVVCAKQRPSAFHLPQKDVPVIMVGAGAGVAPFRGFWKELQRGPQKAPAALFFGCRHPQQDWLFKEEMNTVIKLTTGSIALQRMQVGPKRPLTALHTAFSRPGGDKKGKYVQEDVQAQAVSVKHWVERMEGVVFICGSTAMGEGVLDALSKILVGGKERVEEMRKEGRIVAEFWG